MQKDDTLFYGHVAKISKVFKLLDFFTEKTKQNTKYGFKKMVKTSLTKYGMMRVVITCAQKCGEGVCNMNV